MLKLIEVCADNEKFRIDDGFFSKLAVLTQKRIESLPHIRFGDACSVFRKGIFDIKSSSYADEGVPFVRIGDLRDGLVELAGMAIIWRARQSKPSRDHHFLALLEFGNQQGTEQTVGHTTRAALAVVNLATWPFKVAVMIKSLQTPQNLLRTTGGQRRQMIGTQKSVLVDMLENLPVAAGQLKCWNLRRTDLAITKLPPTAGCGRDEKIVRLPRSLLVNAKRDILDRI